MGGDDLIIRGLKIVAEEFNSLLSRKSKITLNSERNLLYYIENCD